MKFLQLYRLCWPIFFGLGFCQAEDLTNTSFSPSLELTVGTKAPWNQVCTGFDPRTETWSMVGATNPLALKFTCPDGYAFLATRHQSGPRRIGSKIPLIGTCCPLPPQALTEEHVEVAETCPNNYVATGAIQVVTTESERKAKSDPNSWRDDRIQNIRCTKIDTSRFKLGDETNGWYVGWYKHFRNYFNKRTTRARIPEALRYGLGRISRIGWAFSFCTGYPWGSVLVGKTSKYCDGFKFRELQYQGTQGDPPPGTPVHDFKNCPSVIDELDPETTCIKQYPLY